MKRLSSRGQAINKVAHDFQEYRIHWGERVGGAISDANLDVSVELSEK